MEGTFDYYGGSDVYFAFFNSNTLEELDNIPVKNNGLAFDETKSSCTNGATIEWNDELWAPKILNLTNAKTKCSLYFTNAITVTFDPDGGTLDTLTKEVAYNSSYGYLPTPTKAGYTFKGWNGKNMAQELNFINYNTYNFRDNVSFELKTEDNFNYVRVIGYQTGYADTSWFFSQKKPLNIQIGKTYYLSFIVRSQNSLITQYFSTVTSRTNGKTGIYESVIDYDNLICSIEEIKEFPNDGNWYKISSKIYTETSPTNAILALGSDIPNIYGKNSYIDIGKVQLEEGSVATAYEPYYVTSDVKVTRNQNHTLKAIWEENT